MSDPIRPSSALTAVVASLLGARPADGAARLRNVAAILRDHPDPDAQEHARVLEQFDAEGGDLNKLFCVKVGRGRAYDVPSRQRRMRARDDAMRALAKTLPGKVTAQAHALLAMRMAGDPRVLVIHQTIERVPTSLAQTLRILRGS
jgi:hypothetical protein